jgi:hypothetical protein
MVNPKGGPPVTVAAIDARKSNQEQHVTREVLSTTQQIEQARAYAATTACKTVDEVVSVVGGAAR